MFLPPIGSVHTLRVLHRSCRLVMDPMLTLHNGRACHCFTVMPPQAYSWRCKCSRCSLEVAKRLRQGTAAAAQCASTAAEHWLLWAIRLW